MIPHGCAPGTSVKYVFTYDSFRVGEDGPTHQPVEHGQIRLLEEFTRPMALGDARAPPGGRRETTVAWEMALKTRTAPRRSFLTRQSVQPLPVPRKSRRVTPEAGKCRKGAYIVSDNTDGAKPTSRSSRTVPMSAWNIRRRKSSKGRP